MLDVSLCQSRQSCLCSMEFLGPTPITNNITPPSFPINSALTSFPRVCNFFPTKLTSEQIWHARVFFSIKCLRSGRCLSLLQDEARFLAASECCSSLPAVSNSRCYWPLHRQLAPSVLFLSFSFLFFVVFPDFFFCLSFLVGSGLFLVPGGCSHEKHNNILLALDRRGRFMAARKETLERKHCIPGTPRTGSPQYRGASSQCTAVCITPHTTHLHQM